MDHLNEFVVNDIDFNVLRMRLEFKFSMPLVRATGHYQLYNTSIAGMNIFGEGPFMVAAHGEIVLSSYILAYTKINGPHFCSYPQKDITFSGFLRLNVVNGHLNMLELNSTLLMDGMTSKIEGIMGDESASDFYNEMIAKVVPDMMNQSRAEVGRYISDLLMGPANEVLNKITLGDLIGWGRNPPRRGLLANVGRACKKLTTATKTKINNIDSLLPKINL